MCVDNGLGHNAYIYKIMFDIVGQTYYFKACFSK